MLKLKYHSILGWRLGPFMCKATPFIQQVSVCASVNTLALIAVDRFVTRYYQSSAPKTYTDFRCFILNVFLNVSCSTKTSFLKF